MPNIHQLPHEFRALNACYCSGSSLRFRFPTVMSTGRSGLVPQICLINISLRLFFTALLTLRSKYKPPLSFSLVAYFLMKIKAIISATDSLLSQSTSRLAEESCTQGCCQAFQTRAARGVLNSTRWMLFTTVKHLPFPSLILHFAVLKRNNTHLPYSLLLSLQCLVPRKRDTLFPL